MKHLLFLGVVLLFFAFIYQKTLLVSKEFHYHYINNQVLYPEVEGGDTLIITNADNLNKQLEEATKSNEVRWDAIFRQNSVVDNTPRDYFYKIEGVDTVWYKK